jgi:hypothetical protein
VDVVVKTALAFGRINSALVFKSLLEEANLWQDWFINLKCSFRLKILTQSMLLSRFCKLPTVYSIQFPFLIGSISCISWFRVRPVELPNLRAIPTCYNGWALPLPVTLMEPPCWIGGIWLKPMDVIGRLLNLLAGPAFMYCFWILSKFSATIMDISFYLERSLPSSTSYSGSST